MASWRDLTKFPPLPHKIYSESTVWIMSWIILRLHGSIPRLRRWVYVTATLHLPMIGSYPLWSDMVHVSINLNKCYVLICIVMWYTWYTWTHHTCAQGYAVHKTYSDTWCKHKMHKVPAECLSNNFINTDSLLSQQRAMPAAGTGIRTNLAEESIPRQSLDPLPTCQNDFTTSVQDHRDPLGWSSHNQIYLPGSATNAELKLGDGHSSARGPCKVVGKLVNVPQTKANSAPAGASRKIPSSWIPTKLLHDMWTIQIWETHP